MEPRIPDARVVRFATFEVDLRSGEVRKGGVKLKLSGQPFQVLAILLERPGEVVTREELQKRLWPDTFVDSSQSEYRDQQDSRGAGGLGGNPKVCGDSSTARLPVYRAG